MSEISFVAFKAKGGKGQIVGCSKTKSDDDLSDSEAQKDEAAYRYRGAHAVPTPGMQMRLVQCKSVVVCWWVESVVVVRCPLIHPSPRHACPIAHCPLSSIIIIRQASDHGGMASDPDHPMASVHVCTSSGTTRQVDGCSCSVVCTCVALALHGGDPKLSDRVIVACLLSHALASPFPCPVTVALDAVGANKIPSLLLRSIRRRFDRVNHQL